MARYARQRARTAQADVLFDTWLEGATDEQLACRDARHKWEPQSVFHDVKGRVYECVEMCERKCGTTKTRWISDRDGQQTRSPQYGYTEGFLAKGAGTFGGENRGLARLERMHRLTARGIGSRR